jgi:hypothetical protein
MNPTVDDILTAQATLQAEVQVLRKKVESGCTLRAGERRFLLQMLEPVDAERHRILGAAFALDALRLKLCAKCIEKHVRPYRMELKKNAREIGFELE